jgi:hypothetical protein
MAESKSQARGGQQPTASAAAGPPAGPLTGPDAAAGPLVVCAANPRYFTVASGDAAGEKAVYLTGSHIWNNLQDGLGPGESCAEWPEGNDYQAYLAFLRDHGHNFIRLWRWEHFRSQSFGKAFHLCMTPQPWPRSGPGAAADGKPRFDLSRFDEGYFGRLRDRVIAAGNAGCYVSVMLFEGWGLHLSPAPDHIEGHPFHAGNNINRIAISSIVGYQVLPMAPRIQAIQEAYLRKVVDTVHDLPNVLYEVANESSGQDAEAVQFPGMPPLPGPIGDSTRWQHWVIEFVRRHERRQGYDSHPIGMTMQFPVPDQAKVNDRLFHGPADWVSPGFDDVAQPGGAQQSRWFTDPPPNDGTKVVISDTDHYAPGAGDALWAWKSFLRGHNPILMDFGIIDVVHPLDPSLGVPSYESLEPARYAMGDTLQFAQRIRLTTMQPRGDLSSTGYALANPGEEYLILQPAELADPFTVTMHPGTYSAQWYAVNSRQRATADQVTASRHAVIGFTAPFARPEPAVLHLTKTGPLPGHQN